MALSTSDIHWLAGLIEGEGSVGREVRRGGVWRGVRLQLLMTDEDVMQRAGRVLDGRVCGPYYPKERRKDGAPKKPYWKIALGGSHAVAWVMTLYGLLGERRQTRIAEVLAEWRASGNQQYKKRRGLYETKIPGDCECRGSD